MLACASVHSNTFIPLKCFGKKNKSSALHTLAAQGVTAAQPVVVCPAAVAADALHVLLARAPTRHRPQSRIRAAFTHAVVQRAFWVTAAGCRQGT